MRSWKVLFDKDGVLAIDKPAGLAVIPGRGQTEPCLQEQLQQHLQRRIWVVHRLDKDTSGVLLFATHPDRHRELSMAFEAHLVEKRYVCLVEGDVSSESEIHLPLVAARRSRMRVARLGEECKEAITLVRPLERFQVATWLEARPLTGRTHQIRVHLAAKGHPLVLDPQYGNAEPWNKVLFRTPLHAQNLRLKNLKSIGSLEVEAPVPEDMGAALKLLRYEADLAGSTST